MKHKDENVQFLRFQANLHLQFSPPVPEATIHSPGLSLFVCSQDVINTKLSPERYWQGPKSQE